MKAIIESNKGNNTMSYDYFVTSILIGIIFIIADGLGSYLIDNWCVKK
jgi:hypothetical protein